MRKIILIKSLMLSLSVILLLHNCSPSGETSDNGNDNKPTLSSLSPSSMPANMLPFKLTVNGTNFVSSSKITFDGKERDTTYVNGSTLTCQISTEDIQTRLSMHAYNAVQNSLNDKKVIVHVRNPASEGGNSNSLDFSILSNPEFTGAEKTPEGDNNPDVVINSKGTLYAVW